jgi:hypothetical protein
VIGLATTRGALLRGSTLDAYGDAVDAETPVDGYEDFALSLIETKRNVQDPDTGTWRRMSDVTARVPAYLPVAPGDRVRDNTTGAIFAIIDDTGVARGIAGLSSRKITLRQTSA